MTTKSTTTELRRCIGSKTFGIEAHEAPADEFPTQPSQKDGLGRMCKPHWRAYTSALRNAAVARKTAEGGAASTATLEPSPAQGKRERKAAVPEAGSQGDAG